MSAANIARLTGAVAYGWMAVILIEIIALASNRPLPGVAYVVLLVVAIVAGSHAGASVERGA